MIKPEKCYVITLGFHEDVALRRLLKYSNIKRGDKIILFSGSLIDAVKEAYDSLKLYLSKIGVESQQLVSIDPSKPEEAIPRIIEELKECRDKKIITELGGGQRGVGMLILLSLLVLGYKFDLHSQIEGTKHSTDIPWEIIQALKEIPKKEKDKHLLKLINNNELTIKEIAEEIGVSEKTVSNRITMLRKMGLISKRGRGNPKITTWGRTLVKIIESLEP